MFCNVNKFTIKSLKQLLIAVMVYLSFHKLMKFQLIENKKAHVIIRS